MGYRDGSNPTAAAHMGYIFLILLILIIVVVAIKVFSSTDRGEEQLYLPYVQKKYFFTRSEQQFFNILNAKLDSARYTVFPKVRLGDFIEVEYKDRGDRTWWNKIRAKHIDYLIWDLTESKIVLAIELDGNSHSSAQMQERDDFVNELYKKVGIGLERVKVGSDFEAVVSEITTFETKEN